MNEELDKLWSEHNSKIDQIIGKLTVPAMQSSAPYVKECHQELIDLAHWFDEEMEKIATNPATV
jgi:hypothetical protein